MHAETLSIGTIDGAEIEADLVRTDDPAPRAVVVIAHPHPLHGGDRHNHVVAAIQRAALSLGCHSIAPDFRGVGNSSGVHDEGDAERLDLAAACELADMVEPDCPIVMAGYSFGAMVALNVTHPHIAAWMAVAPPIIMMKAEPLASSNHRPKIVVAAEHDQFADLDELLERTSTWSNTDVRVAHGIDHFFMVDAGSICRDGLATVLDVIGA